MKHVLTILFIVFSLCCNGQSYKLFTADRELSSSLVNSIYQDRNGFIWIATEDGLNRYDGAKFTIYKHKSGDPHSISHNYVRTIFEDSKGHLLIGTYMGIQMYNSATDSFSPPAKWENGNQFESNILAFMERQNGEIWVSGNITCILEIKNNEIFVKEAKTVLPTPSYIIEDKSQNLWMPKADEGIYRLSPDNKISHYPSKDYGYINCILGDQRGNIYIGSLTEGLFKYEKNSNSFIPIHYKQKQDLPIFCLYPSGQDDIYIGTDGKGIAIYNINKQEISEYLFDNSYFDSRKSKVHSILKDNSGNLWLAIYQKGVMMIPTRPNSFKYIGHKSIDKNNIGSNCITSICKDNNDIVWVGTDNDGIYGITKEGKQLKHFSPTDSPNSVPSIIIKLYEDSERNLWVGSFLHGLGKLNRQTGECIYENRLIDQNKNPILHIYDFAEDTNKRIWIATMGGGLYYYDMKTKKFTFDRSINKEINNWVSCLRYTTDNKLYVGTYDGVICIDLSAKHAKTYKILPQQIIHCIYEDNNGLLWIGSSDGLSSLNKNTKELNSYTTDDGLASNMVYAIEGDENDNLWISTNSGISLYYKNQKKFTNYYVGDGLQGNEFYKNASFKESDGTIWFGGMNGITYFKPKEIINPAKKWNIRITDFLVHNNPARKGMKSGNYEIINCPVFDAKEFHLSNKDNVFSIEFATKEFNAPERITYLYSVNSSNWITLPKGMNRVSFSNLEPGTYTFQIQAQDNTIYSDIKEIKIHIYPAWYASWWAKSIYCLLSLAIILFIILQIRHRYKMKQEMLQHIHAEQINEAKLQFFINISHEIRTPMSLIISPLLKLIKTDKDAEKLKTYHIIHRNAERILRLINQLMDVRKIEKGQMSLTFHETNIVSFIEDLYNTFAQQAVIKQIQFEFHHDMEEQSIWVDPTNFDKIILNILSNAFKFTPAKGKIDIYIRTCEDNSLPNPLKHHLEIKISDSGTGIDEAEKERIFERFYQTYDNHSKGGTGIGLHLTRSLVDLHHGSIHVENNTDQPGCSFILRLPLGKEHLQPKEIGTNTIINTLSDTISSIAPTFIPTNDNEEPKSRVKSKYHILIVEDDEEIRNYISKEFADKYHILESCNGKEALDILFKKVPDLVISDIMMPEMDGLTLCRKIKQNVNLNHIPVILLTAKTREEDNLEGLNTGADAYIMKPFNIEILQKTAENLIHTRQQLRKVFTGQQTQDDKLQKMEVKSPDEKLMERIMKVINENISNPNLTIETLTTEVGISRVHLHRKLKELTNQTTRDFIRNIRLKQAAQLLSEKQHTIAEIAELTGFTDPNNFSTAFKELYGIPPTTYMKEHLENQKE